MSKSKIHLNNIGRQKISINVPEDLIKKLDQYRGTINRSTWITGAIMEKLANIEKLK